jgi:hypothetical protein
MSRRAERRAAQAIIEKEEKAKKGGKGKKKGKQALASAAALAATSENEPVNKVRLIDSINAIMWRCLAWGILSACVWHIIFSRNFALFQTAACQTTPGDGNGHQHWRWRWFGQR